ncbi:hypothetical protein GE21DRAFT_1051464 [Neurospora crassa]|nr:hypothetical protein GE21DRAFT_1051464 [Neurospora crassa]
MGKAPFRWRSIDIWKSDLHLLVVAFCAIGKSKLARSVMPFKKLEKLLIASIDRARFYLEIYLICRDNIIQTLKAVPMITALEVSLVKYIDIKFYTIARNTLDFLSPRFPGVNHWKMKR